ncbi:MAG TPA: glutathione ABC transporter substrate-binding protein [Bacillota bacterium]|nr:glutathione ABC transporter substrate-binding protein [Bacillota bacterium]
MRRFLLGGLVIVVAGALALSGCPRPGAPAQPAQDLVIAMGVEPESLDPIRMSSSPAATVSRHVTETLIYLDVDGTLRPGLAESWDVSADNLVWTLRLRRGVEFHDGTPFDAEAAKFNLERFLNPDNRAPFRFLIARIIRVEAADGHTLRLHLDAPFAPLLSHLSHAFIGMVSPASVRALPADGVVEAPVGTGPFIFDSWARGEQIVLRRNPDFWGTAPVIETVTFRFVPEDASRLVMLETGEAHAIMRVPPKDVPRLQGDPEIQVVKEDSVRVIYIGFNTQVPPFNDRRVRQALNYAIDKQAIVDTILAGAGSVSTAPIVPAVFGYHTVGPYPFDPARARQLLAEAGFPQGFRATMHHPTGRYMMDVTIVESIQSMLRDVGVELELVTMEWAAYLAFLRVPPAEAKHQMFMLGWGCVTLDADYGIYPLLHSSQWPPAGWGVSYFKSDLADGLMDQARITPDRAQREALYRDALTAIWEDAPWIFLHNEVQINAVRANVQGLIHHPLENIFAWDARIE